VGFLASLVNSWCLLLHYFLG